MIEAPGGVVVARAISGSDVVRHVQTTSDFIENLLFEFAVGRRGLLGLKLAHLPAARHGKQRALLEFDRFKRFSRIGFAIGRLQSFEFTREAE